MSKVTKKQLQRDIELLESGIGMNWSDMKKIETRLNRAMSEMAQQLEALEEFATYADNMLTELNHALPDPEYDAKCEAQEADINASLDRHRERLGLNKPQLKQLDQSAFEHPYVDDRFNYAALNADGQAVFFESKPVISNCLDIWVFHTGSVMPMLKGYDASNWQNSLIERDIAKELLEVDLGSELTGSELCKAMLARGGTRIMCIVSNEGTRQDLTHVIRAYSDGKFHTKANRWSYAVPINNQGEPLTASEAGL